LFPSGDELPDEFADLFSTQPKAHEFFNLRENGELLLETYKNVLNAVCGRIDPKLAPNKKPVLKKIRKIKVARTKQKQ
jgi:hypothetical protein